MLSAPRQESRPDFYPSKERCKQAFIQHTFFILILQQQHQYLPSNCLIFHVKKFHVRVPVLIGEVEINFILMGLFYSPQLY